MKLTVEGQRVGILIVGGMGAKGRGSRLSIFAPLKETMKDARIREPCNIFNIIHSARTTI
jgi:hypothetical protein